MSARRERSRLGVVLAGIVAAAFFGDAAQSAGEPRDPFQFGPREVKSSGAVRVLSGILWDRQYPLAVVDGEAVTVGQVIGGWEVAAIEPDQLILRQGLRKQTLRPGESFPPESPLTEP